MPYPAVLDEHALGFERSHNALSGTNRAIGANGQIFGIAAQEFFGFLKDTFAPSVRL